MKNSPFSLLWQSITEGGLFAGLIAAILQYSKQDEAMVAIIFALSLFILSMTFFNVRLFYMNKKDKPLFDFIEGHDEVFERITLHIKKAKNSIWATRFSSGSVLSEHEYYSWTIRRILGEGCKEIYSYKRIINIDSKDKALLTSELIEKAGHTSNLYIKETSILLPFDMLIIDSRTAFILFHESGSNGTVEAGLVINELSAVNRIKEIYESLWVCNDNKYIKKSVMHEDDIKEVVGKYNKEALRLD